MVSEGREPRWREVVRGAVADNGETTFVDHEPKASKHAASHSDQAHGCDHLAQTGTIGDRRINVLDRDDPVVDE